MSNCFATNQQTKLAQTIPEMYDLFLELDKYTDDPTKEFSPDVLETMDYDVILSEPINKLTQGISNDKLYMRTLCIECLSNCNEIYKHNELEFCCQKCIDDYLRLRTIWCQKL